MTSLQNKTLILTGASMGIGRALAQALAWRGVNLVLSARSTVLLHEACDECIELGVKADFVDGSAGWDEVAEELVRTAVAMGDFVGFIHAAGILHPGPTTWEIKPKQFDEVFEANVRGAYLLVRHAYPKLLAAGEGIAVFFGSGVAETTQPGIGAYCAAKAAEEHLMRQVAEETNVVTTFAYRPGIVETRMQSEARNAKGGGAERLQQVFRPWKRDGLLLTPEQAALGLVSLLEGDVSKLHGQVADVREF